MGICIGSEGEWLCGIAPAFFILKGVGCIESVEGGIKLNLYYRTSILNGIPMRWSPLSYFLICDLSEQSVNCFLVGLGVGWVKLR